MPVSAAWPHVQTPLCVLSLLTQLHSGKADGKYQPGLHPAGRHASSWDLYVNPSSFSTSTTPLCLRNVILPLWSAG
jgi:hypothetical protein